VKAPWPQTGRPSLAAYQAAWPIVRERRGRWEIGGETGRKRY